MVPLNRRHDTRNAGFASDPEMADTLPESHAEDCVVEDGRRDEGERKDWRGWLSEADRHAGRGCGA